MNTSLPKRDLFTECSFEINSPNSNIYSDSQNLQKFRFTCLALLKTVVASS